MKLDPEERIIAAALDQAALNQANERGAGARIEFSREGRAKGLPHARRQGRRRGRDNPDRRPDGQRRRQCFGLVRGDAERAAALARLPRTTAFSVVTRVGRFLDLDHRQKRTPLFFVAQPCGRCRVSRIMLGRGP
jgi:hypothetical protein